VKPIDNHGRVLDTTFSVELVPAGFDILLNSRGGAESGPTPPRNSDYAKGLSLLLERARALECVLLDVQLASRPASKLPEVHRRLTIPGYHYPIHLQQVDDLEDLRRGLGRASAAFGRLSGKAGGNPTKRLRLRVTTSSLMGKSADLIERALAAPVSSTLVNSARDTGWTASELRACVEAYHQLWVAEQRGEPMNKAALRRGVIAGALHGRSEGAYEFRMQNISAILQELGSKIVTGYLPRKNIGTLKTSLLALINEVWERDRTLEMPTADADHLQTRVAAALQKLRNNPIVPRPPGSQKVDREVRSSSRFLRDPNVIAWVLRAAEGHCEICSAPAPFLRHDATPYLEVHHIRPLAEGGPDTVDNAVACCPNCHRNMHYGLDRERSRLRVIASTNRLVDHSRR
jgi:5-methylcytosine-specific restriction enzyme A